MHSHTSAPDLCAPAQAEPPADRAAREPLPAQGRPLVWLAGVEPGLTRALAQEWERRGWRVGLVTTQAAALYQALDRVAAAGVAALATGPQVIVSGVRFSDGDAFELIRRLGRQRQVHGQSPALALVSHQQRAVIRAALALAAQHQVPVPAVVELPATLMAVADGVEQGLHALGRPLPAPRVPLPPLDRAALQRLLEERRIQPYLQPKMRMDTHEVVGFEALMRAHDEQGRLITPDRLIDPLLQHGLLGAATLQMAEQTVAFVAACLGRGVGISASINVSLSLMSDAAFCNALVGLVDASGVDPSWITLEITETEAMADLATVIEQTGRIRMFGFNLSIDDFGTAYSSFFQLSQIPFSELKIERAFVQHLEQDRTKRAIVGACAHLGRSLGLSVVAEGVETEDELQAVEASGCSTAQGFLIARPMPVTQAMAWLEAQQRDGGAPEVKLSGRDGARDPDISR